MHTDDTTDALIAAVNRRCGWGRPSAPMLISLRAASWNGLLLTARVWPDGRAAPRRV